jgi:tripartite-type tricarboxylate transporter receptor subunit TctC
MSALISRLGLLACVCLGWAAPAHADWPDRPIRLIVPSTPGSTPDVLGRILADELRPRLGQAVVVENKQGAGGAIGVAAVAKASADGYTIGITPPGPIGVNRLLYKKMAYDPDKELAPITLAVTQPNVLVVRSSLNVHSASALVSLLARNSGKFTYASVGVGSINHLCMEMVALKSRSQLTRISHGGTPQALLAVVGGEVDMGCLPAQAAMPQVKAGKITALAVATVKRSALLPDLATLKEAGIQDVEASAWMGVIAPSGTPPAVIKRLHEEIVRILNRDDVQARLRLEFMEVVASTPEEFASTVSQDMARWKPVIEARKIEID